MSFWSFTIIFLLNYISEDFCDSEIILTCINICLDFKAFFFSKQCWKEIKNIFGKIKNLRSENKWSGKRKEEIRTKKMEFVRTKMTKFNHRKEGFFEILNSFDSSSILFSILNLIFHPISFIFNINVPFFFFFSVYLPNTFPRKEKRKKVYLYLLVLYSWTTTKWHSSVL